MIESKNNYQVVAEASNGDGCIELVLSKKPELILLDLSLSNQSGFDVARKILSEFKDIKILVVSMYYNGAFVNLSRQIGISGFISKCSEKNELFNAIERVFNGEEYFHDNEPILGNFFAENNAVYPETKF